MCMTGMDLMALATVIGPELVTVNHVWPSQKPSLGFLPVVAGREHWFQPWGGHNGKDASLGSRVACLEMEKRKRGKVGGEGISLVSGILIPLPWPP